MTTKRSKVAEAYKRSEAGRRALFDAGCRPVECTEDKAGIVWERFITPGGRSLVIFATPSWWDVFESVADTPDIAATVAAIAAAAQRAQVRLSQLVALRDLTTRCDGPEGVRADGSNIDTTAAHAALGDFDQTGRGS